MFESDALRSVVNRHVAEISLTCPERLSRCNANVHADFSEMIGRVAPTSEVRAAIISLAGGVCSASDEFATIKKLHDDSRFGRRAGNHALRWLAATPATAWLKGYLSRVGLHGST